jgi:hypothetical protein
MSKNMKNFQQMTRGTEKQSAKRSVPYCILYSAEYLPARTMIAPYSLLGASIREREYFFSPQSKRSPASGANNVLPVMTTERSCRESAAAELATTRAMLAGQPLAALSLPLLRGIRIPADP